MFRKRIFLSSLLLSGAVFLSASNLNPTKLPVSTTVSNSDTVTFTSGNSSKQITYSNFTSGFSASSSTSPLVSLKNDLHCPDDATLTPGSLNYGTDATACVQSALDKAKAGSVIIVWDVHCGISSCTISSNTVILASPGCGAILRANTNSAMFRNSLYAFGIGTPVTQHNGTPSNPGNYGNTNITIQGGTWIGSGSPSQQNNPDHDYPGTFPANIPLNFGRFWGVSNLIIRDAQILAFGGIHLWLGNDSDVILDNLNIDYTNPQGAFSLGDGCIQMEGPDQRVYGHHLVLKGNDDAVAINSDDGGDGGLTAPSSGNITDIVFEDVFLNDHQRTGIRILSTAPLVDRIYFRRWRGTAGGILHTEVPTGTWLDGTGNTGTINFDDMDVQLTNAPNDEPGSYYIANVGKIWNFSNIHRKDYLSSARPTFECDAGCSADEFNIKGLRVNDTSNSSYCFLNESGGITRANFTDWNIHQAAQSATVVKVDYTSSGGEPLITSLLMDTINADSVDYLLDVQQMANTMNVNLSNVIHTNSTKSGSVNLDGRINQLSVSNWFSNAPQVSTGSQNPVQTSGDAFVAVSTKTTLIAMDFHSDANTFKDAGFATPATANNDRVLGWKEDNGIYNATTVAASSATLKTNIQNSLPGVRFDGSASIMTIPRQMNWKDFTIFLVAVPRSTTTAGALISDFNLLTSNGNQYGWAIIANDIAQGKFDFYTAHGGNGTNDSLDFGANSVLKDSATIICVTYNGTTGQKTAYQDNVQKAQASPALIDYSGFFGVNPRLGALTESNGTNIDFYNGDLLEAKTYMYLLSAADRTAVFNALKSKWNL